jgi:hypothetical protein
VDKEGPLDRALRVLDDTFDGIPVLKGPTRHHHPRPRPSCARSPWTAAT